MNLQRFVLILDVIADTLLVLLGLSCFFIAGMTGYYLGIDDNSPMVLNKQAKYFVNKNSDIVKNVRTGDIVYIQRDYCLNTTGEGVYFRNVTNGVIFKLAETRNMGDFGCFENKLFPIIIPEILPVGDYQLNVTAYYINNWMQKVLNIPVVYKFPPIEFGVIESDVNGPSSRN